MEEHRITKLFEISTVTPFGLFCIIADTKTDSVLAAGFGTIRTVRKRLPLSLTNLESKQHPAGARWQKCVARFFSGDNSAFANIVTRSFGTPFQEKVWAALRGIPYGKTVTYTELATMVGKPRAVRAVGTACAKNPNILFTPCHRVIKSDGTVGQYAFGTALKKDLLVLEKRTTLKL